MEHEWIKATFIPAVVAKVRDATNLTRHFQRGHLLYKAVRHPSLSNLAIVGGHVTFVICYLPPMEIMEFLKIADVLSAVFQLDQHFFS